VGQPVCPGQRTQVSLRNVTAVEPHALGDLDLVLDGLALLDGDDTLLADLKCKQGQRTSASDSADMSTFSMAVAMSWPTCSSPLAEMVAT
jgi:hypothetical protein